MHKLFFTVLIFGLIMLPSRAFGQRSQEVGTNLGGQINGQVRYAEGGQPAFNVVVRCDSYNGGSCGQEMTDRTGRFRFSGLASAQYTITVRVPGYIEQQQTVDLLTTSFGSVQFQLKSDGNNKSTPSGPPISASNIPDTAKKEFELAEAALATGKKEGIQESVRHLEKGLSIYPNLVQAQLMLGTAYMDLGQTDKAEAALRKTLALDPKAANAMFALGALFLSQKKNEEAEKSLLEGLQIDGNSTQGHLTLGRVYWDNPSKTKDETKARPSLEKAYEEIKKTLALNPNLGQAHLLKGNLLLRVGRAADAQTEYEEYLRLEPKGAFAEQTRVTVEKIKKALAESPKP